MRTLVVLAGSYLLGCLVAGYYLVRLRTGADVRELGSGNAGARNVARTYGRGLAAATFAVDALKAAAAVVLARALGGDVWLGALALLGVVLGHVFPAPLGFRGGKGAASAIGGFPLVDPLAAAIAVAVGAGLLLIGRPFTRSGLAAIALAPVVSLALGRDALTVALSAAAAAVVLAAHHPRVAARGALHPFGRAVS